jgi:hypothetical protein
MRRWDFPKIWIRPAVWKRFEINIPMVKLSACTGATFFNKGSMATPMKSWGWADRAIISTGDVGRY